METRSRLTVGSIYKNCIINLALVIVSLSLIIGGAEIWLRLNRDSTGLSMYEMLPQGSMCKRDPLLGWIGNSGISSVLSFSSKDMDKMNVHFNSEGFWDDEHSTEKDQGVKRILFLGDSFTIGYGISRENRFAEILKGYLNPDYEIINMGMWGYSTDQELIVLTEKGLKYKPDVVIVAMFLDDLYCSNVYSVNNGMYIKPRFRLTSDNALKLVNVPVPNNHGKSQFKNFVITRYYKLRNRFAVGKEFERKDWYSIFENRYVNEKRFTLALRLLGEISAVSKENGAKFLLVIIPYVKQIDCSEDVKGIGTRKAAGSKIANTLPQKVVKHFCRNSGIHVLDLLPSFERASSDEPLFFKRDLHWTNAGHKLAADEIYKYLLSSGLID